MTESVDIQSAREWLAHWGDGPNWCSPDGTSVPVVKTRFTAMLDEIEALRRVVEAAHLDVMDLPDDPEPAFEDLIQDEISREHSRSRDDG